MTSPQFPNMHADARISFPEYRWPEGKRCAVNFTLDLDAESPYFWVGRQAKASSLGELEQRRYGPRQGVARVLALLEKHGIKACFYVPGVVAATYPDLLPTLIAQGHEVAYHGYFHERLDTLDLATQKHYLAQTMAVFEAQTGRTKLGYRAPSFEHDVQSLAVLREAGVAYDSSLMGFDHPYTIDGQVQIPVTWTIDDALYFRYTNGPRDKTHPANPAAVLESWIEEFEGTRDYGGLCMITVHDWISGRGQRLRMLDKLLAHIATYDDVWFATPQEVADYHVASENAAVFEVTAQVGNFAPVSA
ncbi:polysaccharide deacetylase [Alcaligenaceae bacterium B3P038]|nr:polysaccharide deacetylase [Alcaligenaceae bacterium B3P038]